MRTKLQSLDKYTERKLLFSRKLVEYQDFLDTIYGGKIKSLRDTLTTKTSADQAERIRQYHRSKLGIRKYDIFHLNINPAIDMLADQMENFLKDRGLSLSDKNVEAMIAPLANYVNKLDQIMAIALLRPLMQVEKAEVVVWNGPMWDMAINAEGLDSNVVLNPKDFPRAPQFWLPEQDFRTNVNMQMDPSYGIDLEVDGKTATGMLEAVYLYPVPLDALSMDDDVPREIWVAACFVRVSTGAVVVLPTPIMNFDTSHNLDAAKVDIMLNNLLYGDVDSGTLPNEHTIHELLTPMLASNPLLDASGILVSRPNTTTMAKAVLAAMLFMNESYIGVDRKPVVGDGLVRVSGGGTKKVRHHSKISHVELRRPLRRETGRKQGGREYTCQWLVPGHWRTYKKPIETGKNAGRTLIRIADYWKGPADAPIKTPPPRVITVSR